MKGYRGQVIGLLLVAVASNGCGESSTAVPSATGGVSTGGSAGGAGTANFGGAAGNLSSGGSSGASASGGAFTMSGSGGVPTATGGASATGGSGGIAASGNGGVVDGGGGGAGAAGGSSAGSAGTAGAQDLCPELPVAHRSSGTVLELPVKLRLQDKPLLYAESNPLTNGGTLTPLDIRFYISEVALLRASAEPVPVDVVTEAGSPAPYGVHLYSAEDTSSTAVRVLAPAGEYVGIQFLLGLPLRCNVRRAEASKAPLSPTSQMSWPHTGFLFLRYQGRTTAPASGGAGGTESVDPTAAFPPVVHMGGNLFQDLAPLVRVDGAISVPASGSLSKSMQFVLDEVFKGALMDVDLSGFVGPPGEEVVLGERLRRSMAGLHLFAFEP